MIKLLELKEKHTIGDEEYYTGEKDNIVFIGPIDCEGTIAKRLALKEAQEFGFQLTTGVEFRSDKLIDGYEAGAFFSVALDKEQYKKKVIEDLMRCVVNYQYDIEELVRAVSLCHYDMHS